MRQLTLGGDEQVTMGDVMDAIERATGNRVTATLDADGRILIEDTTDGASKLALTIESTVDGFAVDSFNTVQTGRAALSVNASTNDADQLVLAHDSYGSEFTFQVSGGEAVGLAEGTYTGVDVAGAINGREGTGRGRNLTASDEDLDAEGIVIQVNLTVEELAREGLAQGEITLISGIADRMYSELTSITDSLDGYLHAKMDGFDRSMETLNGRIKRMNDRIEVRRGQYLRRFTQMEIALARLQTIQQQLTSMLGTLSGSSFMRLKSLN